MAEAFNPLDWEPVVTQPPVAAPPLSFDASTSQPVPLPEQTVYIENTGKTVKLPDGGFDRVQSIIEHSYTLGTDQYRLSQLNYELFMGNDTPTIRAEVARLKASTSVNLPTDGWLEEMTRATTQQVPLLLEIFGGAAKRGAQGAVMGGTAGLAMAGIGAVPGFFGGAAAGALVGPAEIAFIQMTGDVFAEISDFTDPSGKKIDPMAARITAVLAGSGMAALEMVPLALLYRLVPGSKQLFGKFLDNTAGRLKIPTGKKALLQFAINISTLTATETVVEGSQTSIQIAAGELVKMVDSGDFEMTTREAVLERVVGAMEEALKATPGIGVGFSTPRLVADLAKGKGKEADPVADGVRAMSTDVVDTLAEKVRAAPVSSDLQTFTVADMTEEEADIIHSAGITVGASGELDARAAELIVAESNRRTDFYLKQEAQQSKTAETEESRALRKVARGAIRKLDNTISNLDQQVDDTLALISEREAQGKAVKALNNKVDRLLKARELMDEERAGLLTDEGPVGDRLSQARQALDSDIELKGDELLKAEARVQKARERALNKGFKEGGRLARQDVKAAQEAVISLLESEATDADVLIKARKTAKKKNEKGPKKPKEAPLFRLSAADKAKFIKQLKNVQTAEQFAKVSARIQAQINTLVTKERRRVATKKLGKLLRGTKIKGNKSKLGPEVQAIMDVARVAYTRPKETKDKSQTAQGRLDELLNAAAERPPSPLERFETQILMLRLHPENISAGQIDNIVSTVSAGISEGKATRASEIAGQVAKVSADKTEFLELIGAERQGETKAHRAVREATTGIEARAFLGFSSAWWNKLKRVMRSSDAARVEAMLGKLTLFHENRAHDRGKAKAVKRYVELMLAAMNTTSERMLQKKMLADEAKTLNFPEFLHSDGKRRALDIRSRAQLRKRVMELRDPEIRKSLMAKEGNAYTTEIVQALEAELDEVDHRLVTAQLQFYDEYYARINEVYERVYGYSLPKLQFYSPIKREGQDQTTDEFMQGIISMYRGGVAPAALKSRTANVRVVKAMGDFAVLHSHVAEMEYFMAFAEKMRHLNQVIGDPEVQTRINRVYGKDLLRLINEDLDAFSKRGRINSMLGDNVITTLTRNFGFAQLAAKPQIALKQLASFAAYAENVKTADFIAGLTAFAANPRKALRVLNDSELFRNRGANIDQDYQALLTDKSFFNFIGKRPTLAKMLMLPIRYGDKSAIAIGGYAHYHAMMKKNGGDHKAALASFDTMTVRTQQSTDIDQISAAQRNSSLWRVMTQFMSSANALTRAEYNAILDISRGRITKREFVKRILVLHVLIPNLIQFISNGFSWDDEDQLRSSLLGTTNGIFLLGDVIAASVGALMSEDGEFFEVQARHPIDFANDVITGMNDLGENGFELEDIIEGTKFIDGMLTGAGALTGLPVKTIANELRGLGETFESGGDDLGAYFKMLGYSPYIIDNKVLDQ